MNDFATFLTVFAQRDYYAGHEILEQAWREESPQLDKTHVYVGLLQFDVALYHWQRENWPGAQKLIHGAQVKLNERSAELTALGIDAVKLLQLITEVKGQIESGNEYRHYDLPLK